MGRLDPSASTVFIKSKTPQFWQERRKGFYQRDQGRVALTFSCTREDEAKCSDRGGTQYQNPSVLARNAALESIWSEGDLSQVGHFSYNSPNWTLLVTEHTMAHTAVRRHMYIC